VIVHVVQPVLPQYRIPFFRRVQERLDKQGMTLRVYASSRDQLGVESVSADGFTAELGPAMSCFLGGRILWQRQLNVPLHSGDVLVLNGNPRLLSNYPLWVRAKRLGVPVLWWGHGWSAGSHGMAAAIRRQIMRIPDGVILYTEKEREQFLALGFSARRTCALNNGLDVESVNAAASAWTEGRLAKFKKDQGLDRLPNWCVFIGRLTAKSKIELLIQSLPKIRADVGLIVLGDGPQAECAKRKAADLGVSTRIVWAGAQYDEPSIAPWMLSASLFVYPGSVGLSLIHAFAYGLPAVLHSISHDHQPEFAAFCEGRNGISFAHGSTTSLAVAVNTLVADSSMTQSLSLAAKGLMQNSFNTTDMAKRFTAAIESTRRTLP